MARKIVAVDLFCGSGGFSTGLLQAAATLGLNVNLTAVNHWKTAINSHALNHPSVTHLCEDVETLFPRNVVPGGHLDLLLASCECTFHSLARGGGPCNEQSRSQPWQLIRWMTDLNVEHLICENVSEWRAWGAIYPCTCGTKDPKKHRKGSKCLRPIPERKGEFFDNFVDTLRRMGYHVEWRVQNCANFGDPTKRKRLILMARKGQPVVWPEPSHGDEAARVLDSGLQPWLSARDHVIDWSLEGKSIFNRKKPLSPNTIRRIAAGLTKFGGKAAEPFLVMLRGLTESHIQTSSTTVDGPLRSVTAGGTHIGLAEPFMLGQQSCAAPKGVSEPVPTIATAGAISLTETVVKPFVLPQFSGASPKDVDEPLGTVTTDGGPALVEGYMINMKGQSNAMSADEPMPTLTAHAAHMGMVEPILVPVNYGERKGQKTRTCDADEPMPTVVGSVAHGVVEPVLIHTTHHGKRPAHSVKQPLPTVTGAHRGELACVEPIIVQTDQTGSNGHCTREIGQPLNTVVSKQNMGLVEPFVCKFYGTGVAKELTEPLDTVTTKDRFLLVEPKSGKVLAELDIRFRMLQPHELAAAHSFPKNYVFTGTKGDQTKQVGNSIPCAMARAHTHAALRSIL